MLAGSNHRNLPPSPQPRRRHRNRQEPAVKYAKAPPPVDGRAFTRRQSLPSQTADEMPKSVLRAHARADRSLVDAAAESAAVRACGVRKGLRAAVRARDGLRCFCLPGGTTRMRVGAGGLVLRKCHFIPLFRSISSLSLRYVSASGRSCHFALRSCCSSCAFRPANASQRMSCVSW